MRELISLGDRYRFPYGKIGVVTAVDKTTAWLCFGGSSTPVPYELSFILSKKKIDDDLNC